MGVAKSRMDISEIVDAIRSGRIRITDHADEEAQNSQETVRRFEEIRRKLEQEEVSAFKPLGKAFQVA
jgi:hypothetical protein